MALKCATERCDLTRRRMSYFSPLSSWKGHSLKGKQEFERKSWVLSAGGRLGCHGNYRVRSPGCCSTRVGTDYATPHLSICLSVLLLLLLALFLVSFSHYFSSALLGGLWGGGSRRGGVENYTGRDRLTDEKKRTKSPATAGTSFWHPPIHPSVQLWGTEDC